MSTLPEGDLAYDELVRTRPTTTSTYIPGVGHVGRRRTVASLGKEEWAFLIVSMLNILTTVALTIERLVVIHKSDGDDTTDFTFAWLLLVNAGFCVFHVFYGMIREQKYEIYVYLAAMAIVVIYCIVQYAVDADGRTTPMLVRLVAACALGLINMVLGFFLIREFGWLEFAITAGEHLTAMWREANRFFSIMLFDLQIVASIAVLSLKTGQDVDTLEIVLLCVGLPLSVFLVAWGWYMVVHELALGLVLFVPIALLEPGYVIYRLVEIYLDVTDDSFPGWNSNFLLYTEIGTCCLAILVRLFVFGELHRVVTNFGRGLKDEVFAEGALRQGLLSGISRGPYYHATRRGVRSGFVFYPEHDDVSDD